MSFDELVGELHSLCVAKGWRRLELSVGCDARVELTAYGRVWPVAQEEGDLLMDGTLAMPSEALKKLAATVAEGGVL